MWSHKTCKTTFKLKYCITSSGQFWLTTPSADRNYVLLIFFDLVRLILFHINRTIKHLVDTFFTKNSGILNIWCKLWCSLLLYYIQLTGSNSQSESFGLCYISVDPSAVNFRNVQSAEKKNNIPIINHDTGCIWERAFYSAVSLFPMFSRTDQGENWLSLEGERGSNEDNVYILFWVWLFFFSTIFPSNNC